MSLCIIICNNVTSEDTYGYDWSSGGAKEKERRKILFQHHGYYYICLYACNIERLCCVWTEAIRCQQATNNGIRFQSFTKVIFLFVLFFFLCPPLYASELNTKATVSISTLCGRCYSKNAEKGSRWVKII